MPKICFVSIDVEGDSGNFEGVENLDKILDIFKKRNVSATLFVTGKVLQKYSLAVQKWSQNFEIACHSFSHTFWSKLFQEQRKQELEKFNNLYKEILSKKPKGFRAPSHVIDEAGIKLLQDTGFLYDSSIVPNYPFFKKYRGYQGRAPFLPYYPSEENCRKRGKMSIFEIPNTGQLFGIPLSGSWISRPPFSFYKCLFAFYKPNFITVSMHPWNMFGLPNRKTSAPQFLEKLEKLLVLIENNGYQFLTGEQIYGQFSKNYQ